MNVRYAISIIQTLIVTELMSQKNELVIEYESHEQVNSLLSDAVRESLVKLTIQIRSNRNTWYSYGRIPFQTEDERNQPSFRIKKPVDSLPWLGGMPKLKSLKLDFLGLQTLPKGVETLTNLRYLDIGFNFISIEHEVNRLNQLKNLEELIVLGLGIKAPERKSLKEENGNLKLYYTSEHDSELLERRRKELDDPEIDNNR